MFRKTICSHGVFNEDILRDRNINVLVYLEEVILKWKTL